MGEMFLRSAPQWNSNEDMGASFRRLKFPSIARSVPAPSGITTRLPFGLFGLFGLLGLSRRRCDDLLLLINSCASGDVAVE
jgi:hypothetical protein